MVVSLAGLSDVYLVLFACVVSPVTTKPIDYFLRQLCWVCIRGRQQHPWSCSRLQQKCMCPTRRTVFLEGSVEQKNGWHHSSIHLALVRCRRCRWCVHTKKHASCSVMKKFIISHMSTGQKPPTASCTLNFVKKNFLVVPHSPSFSLYRSDWERQHKAVADCH